VLAPHGDSDPNYDHRKRRQQTSWRDAIDTAADDRGCFEHANFSLPTPLDQPTIRQSQPIIPRWERLTQPAREHEMIPSADAKGWICSIEKKKSFMSVGPRS
jgi:hypothetical protein